MKRWKTLRVVVEVSVLEGAYKEKELKRAVQNYLEDIHYCMTKYINKPTGNMKVKSGSGWLASQKFKMWSAQ